VGLPSPAANLAFFCVLSLRSSGVGGDRVELLGVYVYCTLKWTSLYASLLPWRSFGTTFDHVFAMQTILQPIPFDGVHNFCQAYRVYTR
jgi:hypothetical protein